MRAPKFAWNPKRARPRFLSKDFWKGRRHRRDSPQENRCWKARPEKQSPSVVSRSWRPCCRSNFPPQKSRRSAWLATEFFEKFRRRQPNQSRRSRCDAAQFEASDSGLFESSRVVLASERKRNQFVQMRRVAETEHGLGVFIPGQLAEKSRGFGPGQQQIRFADFLFWIFHRGCEQIRGLRRANVRRSEKQIRLLHE